MRKYQLGFTFPELLVVLGVLATLFAFATVNLLGAQRRASLTGAVDTTIADIRQQQTKAMVGSTQGVGAASAYGIHFDQNRYVLFKGAVYNSADTANAAFPLDSTIQFTNIAFAGGDLIFSQVSGEMAGFSAPASSVSIRNTTNNETKTIQVNRLGVVTSVN